MRRARARRIRRSPAAAASTCSASTFSAWPAPTPFDADALYAEIVSAEPYAGLDRASFDAALDFVATGGYALKSYDRFAKIRQTKDGRWRVANPRIAQSYRMNVGTIVEADMLKVRLVRGEAPPRPTARDRHGQSRSSTGRRGSPATAAADAGAAYTGALARGGRVLGEIEEYFLETLAPGDTFLFGGEILALRGIVEDEALVSRAAGGRAESSLLCRRQVPALDLSRRTRPRDSSPIPALWGRLPEQVADWLRLQQRARSCRRRTISWSRLSRAAVAISSSPIRSRGGSRIRRSACC